MNVLKELVLLADRLDRKGLNKEADFLDQVLQKMAAKKKSQPDKEDEKPSKDKKTKKELDQDGDGDNDFRDVMMARMKASGVSKEDAKKKTEKHDDKPKAKKS